MVNMDVIIIMIVVNIESLEAEYVVMVLALIMKVMHNIMWVVKDQIVVLLLVVVLMKVIMECIMIDLRVVVNIGDLGIIITMAKQNFSIVDHLAIDLSLTPLVSIPNLFYILILHRRRPVVMLMIIIHISYSRTNWTWTMI